MVKKVRTIDTIDPSKLIKKSDCDTKIKDIVDEIRNHDDYITNPDFNKFSGKIY